MSEDNNHISKPEIIIGIVSRIGTNSSQFSSEIKNILSKYKYNTIDIHITKYLENTFEIEHKNDLVEDRYNKLIDFCNNIRQTTKSNDFLSLAATKLIKQERESKFGEGSSPQGLSYIINQFKKPEEIQHIRKVYGRQCIIFSLHDDYDNRVNYLSSLIAEKHLDNNNPNDWRHIATELISKDDKEEKNNYGQNVRDAFPLADCVFDVGKNLSDLSSDISRFFEYFFGSPYSSPSYVEVGMNAAHTASLVSSDMSRQVGAAIVDEDGCILLTGCNDAPNPKGGIYWSDDEKKARDIDIGYDSNERHKSRILGNLIQLMIKDKWIDSENLPSMPDGIYEHIKSDIGKNLNIKSANIFDILEFSRSVHAEMSIISMAARKGMPLEGKTLFCTTYPCHNCAKHIIASGIKKVYYLEPFPKSLVTDLHGSEIFNKGQTHRSKGGEEQVEFIQFTGIAPHRFSMIFERKTKRKNKVGKVLNWSEESAEPLRGIYVAGYQDREKRSIFYMDYLSNSIDNLNSEAPPHPDSN